jgi:Uma2 family endonuclease
MPSAAARRAIAHDPTVYPTQDDMGEGSLQRLVSELLRILVERWLHQQGKPLFVGADQFFYWKQFDSSESVAPDVYVLPGAPLDPDVGSWKVWLTGYVPSFAFELVSRDVDKDYIQSPAKYARLGVKELIVFDPEYEQSRSRSRWQVFRKTKGGFHRIEATDADRVKSQVLGCHLLAVGEGSSVRVRIGSGINGEELFPTDVEALQIKERAIQEDLATLQAQRQALQAQREALQAKDEALQEERAARAALEAELALLRGLRGPRGPQDAQKPKKRG